MKKLIFLVIVLGLLGNAAADAIDSGKTNQSKIVERLKDV